MNQKKSTISLVALTLVGCTLFHASKTPKGIDVNPIYSFSLSHDVKDINTIVKFLPSTANYRKAFGADTFLFDIPRTVLRNVEISRYESVQAASDRYRQDRKIYSQSGMKVYKEEGNRENRYFSVYKGPWLDSNHGIPIGGVINQPEMSVTYLKRNLIVVVSYHSYDQNVDYQAEMNQDILYVESLLKKIFGSGV